MPNINLDPPPKSGNVEDLHQLQKLYSDQPVIETHVKHLPSSVSYSGVYLVDTHQTVSSPQPGQHVEAVGSSIENQNVCQTHSERSHEKSKNEIIKEISISSTAFIGPTCRPQPAIEEELSEFYKELEQIEHQDITDGNAGSNDSISQACTSAINSPFKKETKRKDHRNAYRPYPPSDMHNESQLDCSNAQRWRQPPQDGFNSYSYQAQWQPPPFGPPYGPQDFQFHRHFPPPSPGNLYPLLPQVNYNNQVENSHWSSWNRSQFPSEYKDKSEECGRNSDWYQYEEQGHHDQFQKNNDTSLVLILMRGLPGSGKSTLAKQMLSTGPSGLILSTDDYFYNKDGYFFDPTLLADAHDWNQERARKAMSECRSPVIIDNTNVKAWEMKPYVAMALERGYEVEFVEPNTRWKCDPVELAKRNKHMVQKNTIAKMLDRFDFPVSVDSVMNSSEPLHKIKEHQSIPHR